MGIYRLSDMVRIRREALGIFVSENFARNIEKERFQGMKRCFLGFLFIVLFLSSCSNDNQIDSGDFSNTTPILETPTGLEISPIVPSSIITPRPTLTVTLTISPPMPTVPEILITVTPMITEVPTTIPTIIETQTSTITLPPTITPSTVPTITKPPTPIPSCTPTPPLLAEGEIPLSPEYFPDEAFRGLLSAMVDTDQNGILTLEEREQLTELRNTWYDMEQENEEYYYGNSPQNEVEEVMYFWLNRVVSLEGIEYFPKLRFLAIDEGLEREQIFGEDKQMKYLESFHAENMPELESVQFHTKIQSVTIKNAPKLRYLYLLPNKSIETCKITLEDCDALETFDYRVGVTPIFDFRLENLRTLMLSVSEDVFWDQVENAFNFSGLERLFLSVWDATKEISLENVSKLERLSIYYDNQVFLSGLNALKKLEIHNASGIEINGCENIKDISLYNIQEVDYMDFSGLDQLEVLSCKDSSVNTFHLSSSYTGIYGFERDVAIDFSGNVQILAPRDILDADTIPADIDYNPITVSGVTECDCTGKTGYIVDLDGDGVDELLYSDETGFYINGVNQGFARYTYKYGDTIWKRFYLVDADETDEKINVVLNAENLGYLRAMHYKNTELYNNLPAEYDSFGQYLTSYENSLTLIGYAESRSKYNREAKAALFSDAVYDGKKRIFFQSPQDETCDFRGIRNGFIVRKERKIELMIAEDGMVEVSDSFRSELQSEK